MKSVDWTSLSLYMSLISDDDMSVVFADTTCQIYSFSAFMTDAFISSRFLLVTWFTFCVYVNYVCDNTNMFMYDYDYVYVDINGMVTAEGLVFCFLSGY